MNPARRVHDPTSDRRATDARLATALVWALVAASAAFWGGKFFLATPARPASPPVEPDPGPPWTILAKVLGDSAVANGNSVQWPPAESRLQLKGVVASMGPGNAGIALIGVEGKAASAYRVGSMIEGGMVLQAVGPRSATLAPTNGAPAIVLELPLPTSSATGVMLPAAGMPAIVGVTPPPASITASDLRAAPTGPDGTPLTPAFDLMQGTPTMAASSPNGPSPGRRKRLSGLSPAPTDTPQKGR
jgi:general secretion pathway protein C